MTSSPRPRRTVRYPTITAKWELKQAAILDMAKKPEDNLEVTILLKGITTLEYLALVDYAQKRLPLKIFAKTEDRLDNHKG